MRKKTQKNLEYPASQSNILLGSSTFFSENDRLAEIIADNTPAFIAFIDKKERYLFTNKVFQDWLGYSKEDTYLKSVRKIRGEKAYRILKPYLTKALSGHPTSFDHVFNKKDGSTIYVNAKYVPYIGISGKVEGICVLLVDITDRKFVEERMRESEDRLKRLIAGNIIGVVISGLGGAVYEANDKYLEMTGYTRADLKAGKVNWFKMTPPEYHSINKKAEKTILQTGSSPPYEKEYIRKDGSRLSVLVGDVLLDKASRKLIAFVLDISKTKELDKRKDEFIALASHELKTPLASLKMYAQLSQLEAEKKHDVVLAKLLHKMDRQLDNVTELVNDLLDVSRIESGKLQYKKKLFVFDKLINETVSEMQRISGRHKLIVKGSTHQNINADRDRIKQVINNLITNAIKYSPSADRIIISMGKNDNAIQVCVQDFGIGIPLQQQNKVFGRFFQVQRPLSHTYSGLGLGLYLCKEIIDRHHGRIWVKSNNKGTKFYFSLPVSTKPNRNNKHKNP